MLYNASTLTFWFVRIITAGGTTMFGLSQEIVTTIDLVTSHFNTVRHPLFALIIT